MQRVTGRFNGTGAAIYICCGFIPDRVRLFNCKDGGTVQPRIIWERGMSDNCVEGMLLCTTGQDELGVGQGVQPYEGDDVLTAANQTDVTWGGGIYLAQGDDRDWRVARTATPTAGEGLSSDIDTWTLDTSANRTGHFNDDMWSSGTHIGVGSEIIIASPSGAKRYIAQITALTAGQGISADEVTLSRAIPSGNVERISSKWSFEPLAVGSVTPAGFKLNEVTLMNVNDEVVYFVAECD